MPFRWELRIEEREMLLLWFMGIGVSLSLAEKYSNIAFILLYIFWRQEQKPSILE